jgi:hypothetical protein
MLLYPMFIALIIHSLFAVQDIYVHRIGDAVVQWVTIVLQTQALVARINISLQNYDSTLF